MDKQKAMQELGIPEELLNELVQEFLKQAEVIIDELKEVLANKDFEEIRKKAHFIKGSAGNLRMDEIYRIAKDMEFNAAENKDIEKLQSDFENFRQAFVELKRNV